jgi:hypothetical protein
MSGDERTGLDLMSWAKGKRAGLELSKAFGASAVQYPLHYLLCNWRLAIYGRHQEHWYMYIA